MSRLALAIDFERCTGCKSCEAACKQEHGLGPGERRNKVVWLQGGAVPALQFLPVMCQHCQRPACLRACPVRPQAIGRDVASGVVSIDESRCTGCGECVVSCPYGAIGFDAEGHHAVKCDLCAARRGRGETTACAAVCPGLAIRLGQRDELLAEAAQAGRQVRDHDSYLLGPSTLYLESAKPAAELAPPALTRSAWAGRGPRRSDAAFPYGTAPEARLADRVEPGGCNICFNSCSLKFHLRDGRLVKVSGNDDDPVLGGRICAKSQMTLQQYHDPRRLKHPMKRIGKRGEGRFEAISWDQALDEIAAKLKETAARYGTESLAIFSGTRSGIMTNRGYVHLFGRLFGTPNVEGTEPLCATGKSIAYTLTQGTVLIPNSFVPSDIGRTGMLVYFGDNQAETRPVYFGMVNDWRIQSRIPMVVIDPRYTVTAAKADRWLALRPGSDMALGLALAQHILAHELHDQEFCEAWVEGFAAWRDFIDERGYDADWAAPICDLPADEIRRLAEEMAAADGCMIFASRGINQHSNSVQTNRVLMFLAAITGNWGRPGGGYFNMASGTPISAAMPEHRAAAISRPMVRRNPANWLSAMAEGKPYPIRALISGNNPLGQLPDQNAVRQAFRALDLVVHIDLFENETSAFADYLLPVATGIEKGGINRANDDRRLVWIDKLIEPPGEARTDGWIWIELGKRFGYQDVLREKYKDAAVFWDKLCADNSDIRGCTTRRLRSTPHRWLRFPLADEQAAEQETLYLEPSVDGKRFPTPSGRLEFWTRALEDRFARLGLSALPEFYSEREQRIDLPHLELLLGDDEPGVLSPFHAMPVGATPARIRQPEDSAGAALRAQGYEYELITGRASAAHFHSWTHHFWQAQEMWPDLYAQMHPELAAEKGIKDGARVQIETTRGSLEAIAWLTPGIRRHAVYVPLGWGERQPFNPWPSVNFLTDASQRDPISDQINLKTLLCRVSPVMR